jgi:hypothetical protein
MRHEDRVRILYMIDAADAVAQFVAGRSREDLDCQYLDIHRATLSVGTLLRMKHRD